ncbi:MAG: cyclic nucleotide-binding domain-containing protein [Bdellovibrionaceae bacterium]|nr:cyclic nucleotide-binding domain-containing protein [Bdellovibrionales bacterium]MCB9255145.1 cyclic nucleotide-binding domain-containing protein [Pseudobdellovibrionaceae bacterium]
MGLLKTITDTLSGSERYTTRFAEKEELDEAFGFREQAFQSLGSGWKGNPDHCPAFRNALDKESSHLLAYDSRTKKPVGYLRLTPAHRLFGATEPTFQSALQHFPASVHPFVSVWHWMAVQAPDSEAAVRYALCTAAYTRSLEEGKAALVVASCRPSDIAEFRSLGFRPLGRVVASAISGHALPIFLDLHGYQSLKLLDSPLYAIAKSKGLPPGKIGSDWYQEFIFRNGSIDTGYTRYQAGAEASEFHASLTEGLKDGARKQLLNNALHLRCRFGETVLADSAHDTSIGLVKKGALEVLLGQDLIAVLGEGDVFGELAFILGGKRNAMVRAASDDTEILVLSRKIVETLKSPADQAQFWRNLATLVAKRVVSANAALNDARKAKTSAGMPGTGGN